MHSVDVDGDEREIRELAAKVAARDFAPDAARRDAERDAITTEERLRLGAAGFLGIAHDIAVGGAGAPLRHALAVVEELARVSRPAAFQVFEANTGPAQVVARLGSYEQRQRWLPGIVSGASTMAVAISEPDAGSAATDMTTTATPTAGGYLINGSKRWISNGGEANLYLVYCRFGPPAGSANIGAVVVDSSAPGFSAGAQERLMGFRGIPSADLNFDDVFISNEDVVVPPGGFKDLFRIFAIERLGNATMSLALGQEALERTRIYVLEREQFGRRIVDFQAIQLTIADMVMQVDAARLLIRRAVDEIDSDQFNALHVAVAKCTANEMAKRVTDAAMQVHGGNGYTEEYGIERLHRDAHGWAIAGGTPNMQRIRIASAYTGARFDQRAGSA